VITVQRSTRSGEREHAHEYIYSCQYMHIHTHTPTSPMRVDTLKKNWLYIRMNTYVRTNMKLYVAISISLYIYVCVSVSARARVCLCVCARVLPLRQSARERRQGKELRVL
jgi:hypothetical protein